MDEREWDRKPQEPDQSWKGFVHFRDQELPRDLGKTARYLNAPLPRVLDWSTLWEWRSRCLAYDSYIDRVRRESVEALQKEAYVEWAGKHLVLARDAVNLASEEMRKFLEQAKESDHSRFRPAEIIKLTEMAIKLERLVRGESTENVGTSKPVIDLSALSLEEVRTLYGLMEKAGVSLPAAPEESGAPLLSS